MGSLLSVKNLGVEVEGKRVLQGVTGEIGAGEVVVLSGPNGSGKSSLVGTLVGSSQYQVTGGTVKWEGENLLAMKMDERARAGLAAAWQNPVAVPGVKVFNLLKAAGELRDKQTESVVELKRQMEEMAVRVGLDKEFVTRGVNEGFSGGERKRLELLQLLWLVPKLMILDEIDSGLDEEGRELVRGIIKEQSAGGTAILLISHYDKTFEGLGSVKRWKMSHGQLSMKHEA